MQQSQDKKVFKDIATNRAIAAFKGWQETSSSADTAPVTPLKRPHGRQENFNIGRYLLQGQAVIGWRLREGAACTRSTEAWAVLPERNLMGTHVSTASRFKPKSMSGKIFSTEEIAPRIWICLVRSSPPARRQGLRSRAIAS